MIAPETEIINQKTGIKSHKARREFLLFSILAIEIGLIIRLSFVMVNNFPLYDGGLFFSMIRDIQDSHFTLPLYTSYNASNLPFAYPPFALYVTSLINRFTLINTLDLLQYMPMFLSMASIFAFILFARAILQSHIAAGFSLLIFAILPTGYRFYITGGGITRATGLAFTIFALYFVLRLYSENKAKLLFPTILFSSLSVASHPEMGLFLSYSILLFFFTFSKTKSGFIYLTSIIIGTALLTSPWWLLVIKRHGFSVFTNAFSRGGGALIDVGSIISFNISNEYLFPILAFCALLGILFCIGKKSLFLPIWVLAIMVIQSRDPRQELIIPVALLGGLGITYVIIPLFRRSIVENDAQILSGKKSEFGLSKTGIERTLKIIISIFMISAIISSIISYRPLLTGLSVEELAAMSWISQKTPNNSQFIIVSGVPGGDRSFEWFPALTNRQNAAPIEGYEWVPGFPERVRVDRELQLCAARTTKCIQDWAKGNSVRFTHVYVPIRPSAPLFAPTSDYLQEEQCCSAIISSLTNDSSYNLIYDGPGAMIFEFDG